MPCFPALLTPADWGAVVAAHHRMIAYPGESDYEFNDGLGVRTLDPDPRQGRIETLHVSPWLAEHPAVEQVIRARAARYAEIGADTLTPVYSVDRDKIGR